MNLQNFLRSANGGISIKGILVFVLTASAILFMPVICSDSPPESAATWNENGTSLYSKGKYSEALQAFDKAIELNPTIPQIWYNKGNALFIQDRYDEAVTAYDKVVELNPQYAYAWFAKGRALNYLKKYDEALLCFNKSIELNPRDFEAWINKGKVLDALGRTIESNEAFAKANELSQTIRRQTTNAAKPIQAPTAPSSTRDVHVESWQKTLGGSSSDWASSVQQTTDGGYIIAGATDSYGARGWDAWLIKTDSSGNEIWSKLFNRQGFSSDWAHSVQQSTDGGYIIAGDSDLINAMDRDIWLIKTDSLGSVVWSRTFGGPNNERTDSVEQTTDGGYIIAGNTDAAGDPSHYTWLNGWQIKTDAEGNKIWDKTYSEWILSNYSVQTTDGGSITAGQIETYNASKEVSLIKTDSLGNELWNRTFGGPNDDWASSVQQTTDGGYIIAGNTRSYGAGGQDAWLIKTDANGNIEGY